VYQTAVLLDSRGGIVGSYRKIHLFDVVLDDGSVFAESRTTVPGNSPVVLSTPWARLGLSICYDVRFPELYRHLVDEGAEVMFVPSAFAMQTGRDHWHVLLRARALENLCYVAAPAQVGAHDATRRSYGHSLVVDPWGQIIAEASDRPSVVVAELDLEYLRERRRQLPCLSHRRLRG
jgi:predicted amidohydrolase